MRIGSKTFTGTFHLYLPIPGQFFFFFFFCYKGSSMVWGREKKKKTAPEFEQSLGYSVPFLGPWAQ